MGGKQAIYIRQPYLKTLKKNNDIFLRQKIILKKAMES